MRRYIVNVIKLFILFICCTLLFYYALRALHHEYEFYQRYDEPTGNAVKVFIEKNDVWDYLHDLFR